MKANSNKGFTLLEILVGMSILSIAILGMAKGSIEVMKGNQAALYNTYAANLAQDKVEELKGKTPSTIMACSSSCDSPALTYNAVTFTRTWTINSTTCPSAASPVSGLICINVTVQWVNHGATKNVVVSSAVYNT